MKQWCFLLILCLICSCGSDQTNTVIKSEEKIKKAEAIDADGLPMVESVGQKQIAKGGEKAEMTEVKEEPKLDDIKVGEETGADDTYMIDPSVDAGTLKMKCVIKSEKPVAWKPKPIDLNKWKIKNPIVYPKPVSFVVRSRPSRIYKKFAGEEDYLRYFAKDPHPMNWATEYDRRNQWYNVKEAVVILHGVKAGKRLPVEGGTMSAEISLSPINGFALTQSYHKHLEPTLIMAERSKITLHNNDYFDDEFIFLDPQGKEMKRIKLGKYAPGKKKAAFTNAIAHIEQWMPHGESDDSPAYEKPGIYTIKSKRYPWKLGHVIIVKNPYAMRSEGKLMVMDRVPVGKYKMEVWHPQLKPKKKFIEVEIKEPEDVQKILIEFEMPNI